MHIYAYRVCHLTRQSNKGEHQRTPGCRVHSKGRPMQALARGVPGNGQRVPATFSLFEMLLLANFIHQNTSSGFQKLIREDKGKINEHHVKINENSGTINENQ